VGISTVLYRGLPIHTGGVFEGWESSLRRTTKDGGRLGSVRCRLNQKKVESAALPTVAQRQIFWWDTQLTGFGLRINATGSRAFVVQVRTAGRSQRVVVGHYPRMTLSDARLAAQVLLGQIAEGSDPLAERRRRRSELTLGKFIDVYAERHASHMRSGDQALAALRRYLPLAWTTRQLSSIGRGEVSTLHHEIGCRHGPYVANYWLRILRSIYNLAVAWDYLPDGTRNPATRVQFFREERRERFLSAIEVAQLDGALLEEPHPIRAAFLLWLLTGVRRNELLCARWTDVSLDSPPPAGPTWVIPTTKNGLPLTLPLVAEVVAMLRTMPSYERSDYVFPGPGKTGHWVEPKTAWHRIRKRAGLVDVRIHDLRRTLASWAAERGYDQLLIGRLLNHSNPSVTAIYARIGLAPLRAALEELTAAFRSAMPQTFASLLPAAGPSMSDGDAEYAYHGLLLRLYNQH
jgi:integrase